MAALRRLSVKRSGLVVAGLAVVAVVGVSSVVILSARDSASEAGPVDCTRSSAQSATEALSIAVVCDSDVEIMEDRTPWARSWAESSGETRVEVSSIPTSVERDGEWVPLDTTLVRDAGSGAVEVAASTYSLEINGGDTVSERHPLGVIEKDGHRLEVWFPLDLPEPLLDGPRATYELDEGVRLELTVQPDGTGFAPIVVLDSPAAAARFERALYVTDDGKVADSPSAIAYSLVTSPGLLVSKGEGDEVNFEDADGELIFTVPPSRMWDSSGARESLMRVDVSGGDLIVHPDVTMLADETTQWPVYIDPVFGAIGAAEWTVVRTGGFTSSIYKFTDPIDGGNGRCTDSSCNTDFTARLSWEFGGLDAIRNMTRADVTSAEFNVNGIHSYSCAAAATDLYFTNEISAGTTWGNLGQGDVLNTRNESQRPSCGTAGWKGFDATEGARRLAENDWSSLTIGLKSQNESTMAGWKRFAYDATLTINYNRAPNTPTSLQMTNPVISSCVTGANRQVIVTATPTLSAVVSDPDGGSVNARIYVATQSNLGALWNGPASPASAASGFRFSAAVPTGTLQDGGVYAWRVQGGDGARLSAFSGWCEFAVDLKDPLVPSVSSIADGAQAVYPAEVESGGVGLMGRFKLVRAATDTDVVSFKYGFNDPSMNQTISVDASGAAVVSHVPAAGPATLSVQALDRGGRHSPTVTYEFDVASPTEDGIWQFDEGTGTTTADSAGLQRTRPLNVTGATWADGPHREFDSRDSDRALAFDGVDDSAVSSAVVVDTEKSFAVSALVKLDADFDASRAGTVLSQDAAIGSGFKLGYHPQCQSAGGSSCWIFGMPDTDGGTMTAAESTATVQAGQWVLLVGEHDAANRRMRLWVCPAGSPSAPGTADPTSVSVNRAATPWAARGGLAVGRARAGSAPAEWWDGRIDSVRVFSGQVVDVSKIRRLCQGAEAAAFDGSDGWSAGNAALDPTVKEQ